MKQSVVILGGGTAGWMTASYLRAAFADSIEVTVVESRRSAPSGWERPPSARCGTSSTTSASARRTGCRSATPPTNSAVRFENWRAPGDDFYHPFERHASRRRSPPHRLVAAGRSDGPVRPGLLPDPLALRRQGSPRHLDGRLFEQDFAEDPDRPLYRTTLCRAEHPVPVRLPLRRVPARRFPDPVLGQARRPADRRRRGGRPARRTGLDRPPRHQRARGAASRPLSSTAPASAAGCSDKALEEPFISYQDSLPNDRAVALRVPVDMREEGIRPCTTATAQDAGWIWTIPLFDRIGTGYVYASEYCEPEEAERTLRDFVGPAADDLEANHIRMRIGRSERSWVNNCVGDRAVRGFVEPLRVHRHLLHPARDRATGQVLPRRPTGDPVLRDSYNLSVARAIDGVREFLSCTTGPPPAPTTTTGATRRSARCPPTWLCAWSIRDPGGGGAPFTK